MHNHFTCIFQKGTQKKAGFSLIEMAVVLVIIGTLVGVVATTAKEQTKESQVTATRATLENAKIALDLYHTKHKRYPCPALPADAPSAATYGIEVAGGCNASCPAGLTCPATTKAVIGAFPYKTLSLGEEYAADDWNNKILYTVDKDHTTANTSAIYGSIPILDKNGNEVTRSVDAGDAIYILLSQGANGNGAWAKTGGAQKTCDATLKDGENCDGDIGIIDTVIQDGTTPAEYFDDIAVWKTRESTNHIVIAAPTVSGGAIPP